MFLTPAGSVPVTLPRSPSATRSSRRTKPTLSSSSPSNSPTTHRPPQTQMFEAKGTGSKLGIMMALMMPAKAHSFLAHEDCSACRAQSFVITPSAGADLGCWRAAAMSSTPFSPPAPLRAPPPSPRPLLRTEAIATFDWLPMALPLHVANGKPESMHISGGRQRHAKHATRRDTVRSGRRHGAARCISNRPMAMDRILLNIVTVSRTRHARC